MNNYLLPSNCYSKRLVDPEYIILHDISARLKVPEDPFNLDHILTILKDYRFSYHLLVDRAGGVHTLAPLEHVAWHAGKSIIDGRERVNNFSWSMSVMWAPKEGYTEEQYQAIADCIWALELKADRLLPYEDHKAVRANYKAKYPLSKVHNKYDMHKSFQWNKLRTLVNLARNV